MFTDYRMKFWIKSADTHKKVFMESDVVRVHHESDDWNTKRVDAINMMHRRLNNKHFPRFRAQLFCCHEVNTNEEA